MGVKLYWIVVALVIGFGMIMPQEGREKKYYIWLMAIIHSCVCGFRYQFIFGDLRKYGYLYQFYNENRFLSWFSKDIFQGGRNAGFTWLLKGITILTNGNFQIFLIILAVFAEIALAILIYRYSPKPWLSYLVWNCMGFFITYDFCAIKQGLAMSVLMFAMIFALERRLLGFLICTLIAGFIHMPALTFLPVYWLLDQKVNTKTILIYIALIAITFLFRTRIVEFMQDIYYAGNDEIEFILNERGVGGRFIVIMLIALAGYFLKGFTERDFSGLFNVIVIAAILQMFANFDNVFTRFADYYLQFAVLYIPMIFYDIDYYTDIDETTDVQSGILSDETVKISVTVLVVVLLWWYWRTNLSATITYEVDNVINYRSMWDVQETELYDY